MYDSTVDDEETYTEDTKEGTRRRKGLLIT